MSKRLTRRGFLGGAGALIALPLLESIPRGWSRAFAAEPEPRPGRGFGPDGQPQRMIFYYVPNGIHMASWTPEGSGDSWALTPILEPLANVKGKLNVLSGLDNRPGKPEGPGDHAAGTGAFLTCRHVHKTEGDDIENGVSVDQLAVGALGQTTRFPSLQLGLEGGAVVGGCDSGYSCAYVRNISWTGPQTPLPKMVNPQLVFDRFFAGYDKGATAEELERRRRYRKSVLDYAGAETEALMARVGRSDRLKLDEFLSSIRELEVQIAAAQDGPVCDAPDYPPPNLSLTEHARIMSDLMVLALQCDLTRVASFMFGNGASGRSYGFLGLTGGHHDLSHHQDRPEKLAALEVIDRYEVEQLAYLLERLDQTPDPQAPGKTLLDGTLVYFSSEIEDGNKHGHADMPILTAGSLAGTVPTGRHLEYGEEPVANLFMTLLDAVGAPVEAFGDDGTRVLPDFLG